MTRRTVAAVTVDGRRLKLTNLEKVLYPAAGVTKAQVLDYYRRIAPYILPHLAGHPVTMKRYPDGVEHGFFYEKRCPSYRPDWIITKEVPTRSEKPLHFCVVNDLPTLMWVANLASIEMHPLLSTADDVQRPTVVAFDLDPGAPADIADCARVALDLRKALGAVGLKGFPKTSGGKGLHFFVPLNTPVTFDETKHFARAMAESYARRNPDTATSDMKKIGRAGKVFIDWSQNDSHKTTVAAYSLRARERPTVSTPVAWKEIEAAAKSRDGSRLQFEIDDVLRRVEAMGDLFEPVLKLKQSLPR